MFEIVFILIIWTWNLTPLWVNIVATIILAIRAIFVFSEFLGDLSSDDTEGAYNG